MRAAIPARWSEIVCPARLAEPYAIGRSLPRAAVRGHSALIRGGRCPERPAQVSASFSDLSNTRSTCGRSCPRFITSPPAAWTL